MALSGGVDSAVSAALLKQEGHDVVAIFMRCWQEDGNPYCTALEDEQMARRVAAHLDIPFYSWNFIDRYKEKVVSYLIEEYKKGLTPNPDMMCNKEIKFGLFFQKAMALGADYVATGHYARIVRDAVFGNHSSRGPAATRELRARLNASANAEDRAVEAPRVSRETASLRSSQLLEGIDKEKDQSYFLALVPPPALEKTLFPIGEYKKPKVRELAKKFGLPNATRKDSQGICFIGKVNVTDFLKQHIKGKEGDIVDMEGKVLGRHDGIYWYTVGQRHGLELSGGPYYVVQQDIASNTLIVSKDEKDLLRGSMVVRDINWMAWAKTVFAQTGLTARIRYRGPKVPVFVEERDGGGLLVTFSEPQRAVTPGQFAVLYSKDRVLCAGVIEK